MNAIARDRRPIALLATLALLACTLALVSGVCAGLAYTDAESALRAGGLTLRSVRPIHETFAFAWAFLGGTTVVHAWMIATGGPLDRAERTRFFVQVAAWAGAGVGIVITLLAGHYSGREYAGYDPLFAAMILVGWALFAWNYFGRAGFTLVDKPVYQYMWTTGIGLFAFTLLEAHAYLLDELSRKPVRDLAIQWKANGVMVGSFNQLLYGSLMWISCQMRGDESYARSKTAFALFTVGVLNTFTNYGHHTYHLPQTAWIHRISFSVSMLEVVILAKVVIDLWRLRRNAVKTAENVAPARFAASFTLWSFLMLTLAIAMSIPALNSLIHGTHVVVAHAMGSMIGIDSTITWMALAWILVQLVGPSHRSIAAGSIRFAATAIDVLLALWLVVFLARGVFAGVVRYVGSESSPDESWIVKAFPFAMAGLGSALAIVALWFVVRWLFVFVSIARRADETANSR